MSSENHGHSSSELLELLGRDVQGIRRQPKFSYTRDILLSLRELDICKKLPAGFDASLLREFGDASGNSLHPNRNPGGFYLQSSRRNEYGYVQTTSSVTSSNYYRGSQGKWETRSSGSSDREELQTKDSSDSGKHSQNQPRRLWKQMEQDGLLGKPSGYSGQAPAQRSRGNDLYTLNKSTGPYQPPRPYQAISHSWRDKSDSINDETFGSSDCSEDRAEEETKRRASFELMRKEQQKALQEKQKQITDNHKVDSDAFSMASLKDHEGSPVLRNKNEDDVNIEHMQSDSSGTVQTQSSASRPLVPPGFRSTTVMKNVSALASVMNFASEAGQAGPHILPMPKYASVGSGVDSILEPASITSSIHTTSSVAMSLSNAVERAQVSSPISRYSDPPTYQAFGPVQATEGWMDTHVHSNFTKSQDNKSLVNMPSSQDHPKSILDELFQNASKQNDGDLSSVVQEVLTEEHWSTSPFTSKFSDWFPEERKQSEEKTPPKDLFSQFNNEKAKSQEYLVISGNAAENADVISSDIIPNEKVVESISSFFPFESDKTATKVFDANSNLVQTTKDYYAAGKPDASLSVLTCEDLEQSILAEANATGATKSLPPQWHALHVKSDPPTDANDHVSQHLRLLLHVGSDTQNLTSNFNVQTSEIFSTCDDLGKKPDCANDNFNTSENVEHYSKGHNLKFPLAFEGLFPADVMEGLQSTEGPLSKQTATSDGVFRTSIASQTHEPSHLIYAIDDPRSSLNQAFGYVAGNEVGELSRSPVVPSHQTQESWTGFKASSLGGFTANGTFDINSGFKELRLPEEESWIGPGETPSSLIPDPFSGRNGSRRDEPLQLKSPENILERLAIFNPLYGNKKVSQLPGTECSCPIHGSFDLADLDPQHRQLHGRLAPFVHQISQTGLPFQQHGPREFRSAHREFTAPDSVSYDPHRQFPVNIVHPQSFHNVGLQVDQSAHPQMLPNMHVPGNFPLQELHGFSRGVLTSHPMNHVPQMPEMNLMYGASMSNRHTSQSDTGMEIPGMAIGGTLGRIFAMDARAARQTRPLAGSHLHGSYTPEVDLGFRYR